MDLTCFDRFDDLYVVSDLHIGGKDASRVSTQPEDTGSTYSAQMFAQGPRLGAFIRHIKPAAGRTTCLVLAGDVIDSLPDLSRGRYLDVDGAGARLTRIAQESVFAPVFAALRDFCATPGASVVILLGNHDLELAFSSAQAAFRALIGAPPGCIRFRTDGCGYTCIAGGKRVYVTHGNEADPWNHVDHEQLRRARHRETLGLPFYTQDWQPNAGTALVVDAMNAVKTEWPFVDLLKPEMAAAVPAVAAIDPTQLERVLGTGTALRRRLDAARGAPLVLGANGEPTPVGDAPALFLDAVRALRTTGEQGETTALWERVEALDAQHKRPTEVVSGIEGELGIMGLIKAALGLSNQVTELRKALAEWTRRDQSFVLGAADVVCKGVVSQVGDGFDVVIAGHTHLPRIVRGLRPGITYFNTGTWARVMRLPEAVLADDEAFLPVYDAMKSGEIHRLDTLAVSVKGSVHRVLLDLTPAAHVGTCGGTTGTLVELLRVEGVCTVGGTPVAAPLTLTALSPDQSVEA